LVEEVVHLVGRGGRLVTQPPVEHGEHGAGEGVSASGAANWIHRAGGGHRSEAGFDAAGEVALAEFKDIVKLLRFGHRGDELALLAYMGEKFVDGGDTIGFVTVAHEGHGHHLEEIFHVAEEEIVLTAEMIVESGAADARALKDVLDSDGVERLFLHEGDERVAESVAGLAHATVHFLRGANVDEFPDGHVSG
jgi:hypothetical protein